MRYDTLRGFHCPRSSTGYVPVYVERVSLGMPRQVHCTHITTKCYVYTYTYIKHLERESQVHVLTAWQRTLLSPDLVEQCESS